MTDSETFKKSIGTVLKAAGFVKKRNASWYLNGPEVIVVLNLQKSAWSNLFYINVGFWLKPLGEAAYPLYYNCHLYYRVERLFPDDRELILFAGLLDEANNETHARLLEFFQKKLVPFLHECTRITILAELMKKGLLEDGLVLVGVKDYLLSHFDG